jgi:secreted trypsin-like serine protease
MNVFNCGGIIVSKNHILSAAHCFIRERPVNAADVTVYIGSTKLGRGTQYNVTDLKIHESYLSSSTSKHDIALLTLSQDIEMGEDVAAACLPTEPVENYVGQTLIVSGWGYMRDNKETEDLQVLENLEIMATNRYPEYG